MKPIDFPESNRTYAEDQPEYLPLPVLKLDNPQGEVISCWELTEEEKESILKEGKIWLSCWTFNQPLQPLMLFAEKPQEVKDHE